jgi:hypothetical protein
MSKIEVNTVAPQCGTTLTLGESGDTVTLGTGASQSGFGRTGTVDWQTTPKTATFTAVSGEGYFINSGSAITVNLPAGSAGAIVSVSDYARNFATYNLSISPNGSEKIGGIAQDATLNVDGQSATFIYVDSTKGWINVQNAEDTETGTPPFIQATGGTITTSSNCKIHTFTGPGTFEVTSISPTPANNAIAYMVVAGGGAGGDGGTGEGAGGAGAGGFREGRNNPITPYTASPLAAACSALTASATSFPITVGAGGAPSASGPGGGNGLSGKGSNSIFSTITSTGGGAGISGGASASRCASVHAGGSGGGGNGRSHPAGNSGNTPPVTPAQGFDGGAGSPAPLYAGGAGGGATAVGLNVNPPGHACGGAGATTSINATPTAYAGGGGNGNQNGPAAGGGAGGAGGGGTGGRNSPKATVDATVNTGGGGGGNSCGSSSGTQGCGGAGGSGIVIIRYKFQ